MAIHSLAIIEEGAEIADSVSIGAFSIVHSGTQVGEGSIIESHCILGHPNQGTLREGLILGENSHVRSHSIIYAGATLGPNLRTGHRVTIREGTVAGTNLHVGTLSDIQGECTIGNFVRMHSNVHIGQGSVIGNFVWIYPYVVLTNDPHPPSEVMLGVKVEDYAVIATMSVILPGITVGEASLVGAHSLVNKDVPEKMIVAGNPARVLKETASVRLSKSPGNSAYPWTKHFRRGFPPEIVAEWDAL